MLAHAVAEGVRQEVADALAQPVEVTVGATRVGDARVDEDGLGDCVESGRDADGDTESERVVVTEPDGDALTDALGARVADALPHCVGRVDALVVPEKLSDGVALPLAPRLGDVRADADVE